MRPLRARPLWLALLVCPALVVLLAGGPAKDPDPERLNALARKLADKRYAQREAAGKDLVTAGERALPAIREVIASPDLEAATRARALVRAILRHVGISKTTGMELAVIDEGKFDMGSPPRERGRRPDETPHRVRITRPFLLGTQEVTQAQYEKVMKVNPSYFSPTRPGGPKVAGMDTGIHPVEQVSWFDAVEFCNRLSELDGFAPFYKLADVGRNGDSIDRATVSVLGGNGYRLPTEAEWELASRAYTTGRFHFGDENSGQEANTQPAPATGYGAGPNWRPLGRTATVGSYSPNGYGLYNMHGNVAEWCQDWYDRDYYANSPADDPKGPEEGTHRVLRGGSWLVADGSCRSASRLFHPSGERYYYLGFRVARSP